MGGEGEQEGPSGHSLILSPEYMEHGHGSVGMELDNTKTLEEKKQGDGVLLLLEA